MKRTRSRRKPEYVKVGHAMVKVYRRSKELKRKDGEAVTYRYFEVEDLTGGRRILRSFNDHDKAIKEAERIAGQISSGQTTAASMTNPEAASYGRAIELIRPYGLTLEVVCANYATAVKRLGGDMVLQAVDFYCQHRADKIQQRTVAQVVAELLEKKKGKSERYISDLSSRLNRFANMFQVDISSVTPADVQGFLDKLNVATQTQKNFRTVLHTLFKFAEARNYIMKHGNPVLETEAIEVDDSGPVEIYTPTELARLIESARVNWPDFLPSLLIGAFAGLRSSEIERLSWNEVKVARGHIVASGRKRGTPSRRTVPILPNLAQWLQPYIDKTGKVWPDTHDHFSDAQQAVAAGTAPKKGEEGEPVVWKHNALRHSFISYRLAVLQDDAQTALEAGNSRDTVHRHYKELVTPDDAAAWFGIAPEQPANIIPMEVANG